MDTKAKKFVAGIKAGKSATQAYIDAGYSVTSRQQASRKATELKKSNRGVRGALERYNKALEQSISRSAAMDRDYLLNNLRPIAEYATSDYVQMDEDGNLKYRMEAINDPIKSKAIKQVRCTQYGVEIVFHDKNSAIAQIAKMIGADQPKQEEAETVRFVFEDGMEELMENA